MTEQDRGAYTPQAEAPLAFDPRGPRERRPAPMTLIASAAVLLVLIAAIVMAYRRGRAPEGPARAVGAPLAVIKTTPPPPPAAPTHDAEVFAAQNVPNSAAPAPTFAPPPEQPAERPSSAQLQVRTAAPPAPVRIESASTRAPAPPAKPIVVAPAGSTVIRPGVADATAATATVKIAGPLVDPAAGSKPGHGHAGVQIGAFSSRAMADKGLADVGALMAGDMRAKSHLVSPLEKDGKTLYRTVITGFRDLASARAFCVALTAKGHACIVKS